jgi:hypothetical protein
MSLGRPETPVRFTILAIVRHHASVKTGEFYETCDDRLFSVVIVCRLGAEAPVCFGTGGKLIGQVLANHYRPDLKRRHRQRSACVRNYTTARHLAYARAKSWLRRLVRAANDYRQRAESW